MAILQANIDAVATANGTPLGGFQTITGGEVTAENVKDRPPGARFDDAVDSLPTTGNITISRSWEEGRDRPFEPILYACVGWADACSVGRVRRDRAQNQTGLTSYRAKLVRVTMPEGNSNGGADKGVLELEFEISGGPSS